MKTIKNKRFEKERELYNVKDITLSKCAFKGKTDGESPLKECSNIKVNDCLFDLRYALWHDDNLTINKCKMTKNCRAPLWYCINVLIKDTHSMAIKSLRECSDINIVNSYIDSDEFGWNCNNCNFEGSKFLGNYFMFNSKNIEINNCKIDSKYSLQYCENVELNNCVLKTKDCLWHAKNVILNNCIIDGQYMAWYSENVKLINCKIKGTQPFCYCKKLKLINCEMIDADLAFEYSDVQATINSDILSIKNPLKGKIVCNSVKEIILSNSKHKSKCKIKEKSAN